jgi:hypothetical protein
LTATGKETGLRSASFNYSNFTFEQKELLDEQQRNQLQPLIDTGDLVVTDLPYRLIRFPFPLSVENVNVWYHTLPPMTVGSSHPHLIPQSKNEIAHAIATTVSCAAGDIPMEIPSSKELSDKIELTGFALITLAALQLNARVTLNALARLSGPEFAKSNYKEKLFNLKDSFIELSPKKYYSDPPSLKLGVEVDEASKIIDLAELPLGGQLMQLGAIAFRNLMLKTQADKEFTLIQSRIYESLTNPNIGYLIEAPIYYDDAGYIFLPYGQILYPIGVGIEPIDAFAEHLRHRQLRPGTATPAHLQDNTFFIWITRVGTILQARTIPKEFRQYFLAESLKEATRRDRLGDWRQSLPLDPFESIQRAQYWSEVERTRLDKITKEEKRREIQNLSTQMRSLETRTNSLYQQYQEVQANLARQQKYYDTLGTVSSLSSLVRSAIEFHDLVCTTNGTEAQGSDLASTVSVPASLEISQSAIIINGGLKREISGHLKMNFQNMRDLEDALERMYQEGGVPLPKKDIFIPPPLP